MRQKIGQPGGVIDVGLAPRHVLDMRRIRQHQGKIAIAQDMPHRFPVDAGRLHRDVRASRRGKPVRQGEQILGCRLIGADLAPHRAVRHLAHASRNRVLAHVEAGAIGIQNFHATTSRCAAGVGPCPQNSRNRAAEPSPTHGAIRGAQASPVQLIDGLSRTKANTDLRAGGATPAYHRPPARFIPCGSATPVAN